MLTSPSDPGYIRLEQRSEEEQKAWVENLFHSFANPVKTVPTHEQLVKISKKVQSYTTPFAGDEVIESAQDVSSIRDEYDKHNDSLTPQRMYWIYTYSQTSEGNSSLSDYQTRIELQKDAELAARMSESASMANSGLSDPGVSNGLTRSENRGWLLGWATGCSEGLVEILETSREQLRYAGWTCEEREPDLGEPWSPPLATGCSS